MTGSFHLQSTRNRFLVLGLLVCLLVPALAAGSPILAQQAIRIIWLHHSCGENLIDQGGVREGLAVLSYEFYDHGYNDAGLRLADGSYAGYNYDEYLGGHPNLVTFDFFGHLAGDDNFLRPEYRVDEYDAHPNEQANREIGPIFVRFVDQAIRSYGLSPAAVARQPAPATAPPPPPEPQEGAVASVPSSAIVDDFELGASGWQADHDEVGSSVSPSIDSEAPHGGSASLRIEYSIVVPGGWGGCTHPYESLQDWNAGEGLSLWVRSDAAGQRIALMVFAGDPMAATPFEVFFQTTVETANDWTQLVFRWSDLEQAEWADPGGLPELDPAQIVGYGFGLGLDETHPDGVLWVDDISLATGRPEPAAPLEPTAAAEPVGPTLEEPSVAVEPVGPTAEEPALAAEAPSPGVRVIFPEGTAPAGERSGGGICPLAAMLPAGVAAILLVRRRRGAP